MAYVTPSVQKGDINDRIIDLVQAFQLLKTT